MKIKLLLAIIFLLNSFLMAECQRCIVIYGDTRTDKEAHKKVVEGIMKIKPKIVFHDGDMVADSSDLSQWKNFEEVVSTLMAKSEFFPVIGNHELKGLDNYFSFFKLTPEKRWYSLDREGIHFIVLDSFSPYDKNSPQYIWLENDLKSNKNSPIIVISHVPFYSSGYHFNDCIPQRKQLEPLLVKYGVKAVFSGHDHFYERSYHSKIYYIVTGGGGAPLYKKEKERINPYSQFYLIDYHFITISLLDGKILVEAMTPDLKVFDSFTIPIEKKSNKKIKTN
jgi:predicted MPP superfamily phosphohydrolase